MKHLLMCLIWLALSEPSCAKAITDYLPEDSIHVMTTEESDTLHTSEKKKSLITRFLDYFNDANKNKKHKKFDFSIIGGPHYSTDTKLGLQDSIVPTPMIRSCLLPTCLSSAM